MTSGSLGGASPTSKMANVPSVARPVAHLPSTAPLGIGPAEFGWSHLKPRPKEPKKNYQGKHSRLQRGGKFSSWKYEMQDHNKSTSKDMWRIVVNNFNPVNHNNLTSQETFDDQLNASACMLVRKGLFEGENETYFMLNPPRNYGIVYCWPTPKPPHSNSQDMK